MSDPGCQIMTRRDDESSRSFQARRRVDDWELYDRDINPPPLT